MKVLRSVTPTPEQLPLLTRNQPGVVVIRGAAGSGKTTTALLRIRFLVSAWSNRRARLGLRAPVRVLVLTYNRTLRGYLAHMAEEMAGTKDVELEVSTFARWALKVLKVAPTDILPPKEASSHLAGICREGFTQRAWAAEEAEYVMGRFLPGDYDAYLECDRQGRRKPCDRKLRQRLLDDVILPYQKWLDNETRPAFVSLSSRILSRKAKPKYDVVVIDEAQDFTANEVRAVTSCLATDHSITFVLDAAQRIYPRGFTWREAGISVSAERVHTLKANYRNTRQIASFIVPLLEGIDIGEDGSMPDLTRCDRDGPLPRVLVGKYDPQVTATLTHLRDVLEETDDSVVFLHPRGGSWFEHLRGRLRRHGTPFVEITRQAEWPTGSENVALSTMHSAKGLEFDHVVVLGLNSRVTDTNDGTDAADLENARRLLAMALGRARKGVLIGYKPEEVSDLVRYFRPGTFEQVKV